MPGIIQNLLSGTVAALTASVYNLAQDDAVDAAEYPRAQRIEHLDSKLCPLCRALNGKIIDKSHADYAKYQRQYHMNCRGYWVDIHRDEVDTEGNPTQPDWVTPDADLVRAHGHFIANPKAYGALNCPARPTGRDFIFARGNPGEPGTLIFAPALPPALLRQTLAQIATQTMGLIGSAPDASLAATLEQCVTQSAQRAVKAPQEFIHHFDDDASKHGQLALGLGPEDYARLPAAVLDAEHSIALADYRFTTYRGQVRRVLMVRADEITLDGVVYNDVGFFWEPKGGFFFHPGSYDLRYFQSKPNLYPLTGDWQ